MAIGGTIRPTLAATLWPADESHARLVRGVLLMLTGTVLLTLSAKLKVPFWPVPMTMQTFAVLLIGAAYGWRLGAATIALYLAEGAMGLPVFAGTPEKGIGLAYMLGPTGGYLVGFVVAAAVAGWLAERGFDRSRATTALAMLAGTALIYLFGFAWLAHLIGFDKAMRFGVLPFLLADALKLLLATFVLPLSWTLIARHRVR
jgi:biotin transport system substrate-specific component